MLYNASRNIEDHEIEITLILYNCE